MKFGFVHFLFICFHFRISKHLNCVNWPLGLLKKSLGVVALCILFFVLLVGCPPSWPLDFSGPLAKGRSWVGIDHVWLADMRRSMTNPIRSRHGCVEPTALDDFFFVGRSRLFVFAPFTCEWVIALLLCHAWQATVTADFEPPFLFLENWSCGELVLFKRILHIFVCWISSHGIPWKQVPPMRAKRATRSRSRWTKNGAGGQRMVVAKRFLTRRCRCGWIPVAPQVQCLHLQDISRYLRLSQDYLKTNFPLPWWIFNLATCCADEGWPSCSFWKEHGRKVIESRSCDVASIRSYLL